MSEGLGAYAAGGHFLQAIVAHGGCGAERGFHVAFFEQAALLRRVRPDAREAIGLQFEFYGERIYFARILFLKLAHFSFDPGELLNVVAEFVSENVGLRELAGRAEAAIQFIEETQVDVDFFVLGAIKRAGGGLRVTATRVGRISKQYEFGVTVLRSGLLLEAGRSRFFARHPAQTKCIPRAVFPRHPGQGLAG